MNREEFLKTIPVSMLSFFKKAFSGKGRASAVKAKCLDCCCFNREEITNCMAKNCPLWNYRPYQKKVKNEVV